jgi:hypothetical protein
MFAVNRRQERHSDMLEDKRFKIENIVDYTSAERKMVFLEGTGSLLLDRANEKHMCFISKADENCLLFCEILTMHQYCLSFQTVNGERKLIYHTNVMMWAETFAVICADCIDDERTQNGSGQPKRITKR